MVSTMKIQKLLSNHQYVNSVRGVGITEGTNNGLRYHFL
jgi:hypothetical protein